MKKLSGVRAIDEITQNEGKFFFLFPAYLGGRGQSESGEHILILSDRTINSIPNLYFKRFFLNIL